MRLLKDESELMKINFESTVKKDEFAALNTKFKDYAQLYFVKELQEDMNNFISRDHLQVVEENILNLQKDLTSLIPKIELTNRLN